MRRAATFLLLPLLLAACGPSEAKIGRAVAAAAEPAIAAFVTDLEADRIEAARARGTAAFQAAAGADAVRSVQTSLRGVMGPLAGRTFVEAVDLPPPPAEDQLPGAATLVYRGRYAKGTADLRVRVLRGPDGAWRIDGFVAESPALTFRLR
jgi:hypothetical protein